VAEHFVFVILTILSPIYYILFGHAEHAHAIGKHVLQQCLGCESVLSFLEHLQQRFWKLSPTTLQFVEIFPWNDCKPPFNDSTWLPTMTIVLKTFCFVFEVLDLCTNIQLISFLEMKVNLVAHGDQSRH